MKKKLVRFPNTDICFDIKTILFSDRIAKLDKTYFGGLTRDDVDHYTFVECSNGSAPARRNPKVFDGEYLSKTIRKDGSFRLNLKPVKVDASFNVDSYAIGVCNEIREALNGLIEKAKE